MLSYHACSLCDSPVRRSRIRNVVEFLISPIVVPYRCRICDKREFKFRFMDMNPGSAPTTASPQSHTSDEAEE